jgi:anti-sigma B factor antagonist
MRIVTEDKNDVKVMQIFGKLDTDSAPELEIEINQLIEAEHFKILLDFENLDFIASTGLRVILSTGKKLAKNDSEVRLCNFNDTVEQIFTMSGFEAMFKIFSSQEEALENY